MKESLSVAIVFYEGLDKAFFFKSLYSCLAQIGIEDFKINVYYEKNDIFIQSKELQSLKSINKIKEIPKEKCTNPIKVREYIVNDTETDYIAFWDSDDVFRVDRLYEQMKEITITNADMCFSDFNFFTEKQIYPNSFFEVIGFNNRKINLYQENYMGFGITTFKTSFLKNLMPFPYQIKTLDWWIILNADLNKNKITYCNKSLGFYRFHSKSLSNLLLNPKEKDFLAEINNKIEIYKLFLNRDKKFTSYLEFVTSLNDKFDFQEQLSKYKKRKYRNPWGGLIINN